MIKITYNKGCRLGNRLYLYAAGRLLAAKLKLALIADPLDGFPSTRNFIDGNIIREPVRKLNGADPIPSWPYIDYLHGSSIEIEHGFVNSKYFIHDRALIKKWFDVKPIMHPGPDDVLVNVRLREFCDLGLALDPCYYTTVLNRLSFDKLYLMTDDPKHEYLRVFDRYNPEYITGYGPEHFLKAIGFNRIVMSNSTFCWWFTFLSDAEEIYFPMINGGRCGSWCIDHLPAIDLRLDLPGVTHVYNIPNWTVPCTGPTEAQVEEALTFGKYSRVIFL